MHAMFLYIVKELQKYQRNGKAIHRTKRFTYNFKNRVGPATMFIHVGFPNMTSFCNKERWQKMVFFILKQTETTFLWQFESLWKNRYLSDTGLHYRDFVMKPLRASEMSYYLSHCDIRYSGTQWVRRSITLLLLFVPLETLLLKLY